MVKEATRIIEDFINKKEKSKRRRFPIKEISLIFAGCFLGVAIAFIILGF